MTLFWLLALGLVVIALTFVWWPFMGGGARRARISQDSLNVQAYKAELAELKTDHEAGEIDAVTYESLCQELELNMLADVPEHQGQSDTAGQAQSKPVASLRTPLILSVLLVGTCLALYLGFGRSQMLAQMDREQQVMQQMQSMVPLQQIDFLERELKRYPESSDLWYALSQSRLELKQFAGAVSAYQKLLELEGDHPQLMAEYAQTLYLLSGNRVTAEVRNLIVRVVAMEDTNVTALGLFGVEAFDSGRYLDAIRYWERALEYAEPQRQAGLRADLANARDRVSEQSGEAVIPAGPVLNVTVELGEKFAATVQPDQTVFVFARALAGPPMPLAVARMKVADLPAQVTLDDSMAMSSVAKLSSFQEVEVVARVSPSGRPVAQPGDLEGKSSPVSVHNNKTTIKIRIDYIVE